MVQTDLVSSSHSVGRRLWVFEWCTKYRHKMMRKSGNRNLVAACVRNAAFRHSIRIVELSVMPEHVHMIASLPKGMDDIKAVNLLKGASARKIFAAKDNFAKHYPRRHFWSRGYYASTVGVTDLETQVSYLRSQEEHHGLLFLG